VRRELRAIAHSNIWLIAFWISLGVSAEQALNGA
jgi:hypothetical protein